MNYTNDLKELNKFARNCLYNKDTLTLTSSKLEILSIVNSSEQINASKITELTAMKKEAVSRIVRELVEEDYLKKQDDANDKRVIFLEITEKGKQAIEENYDSMTSQIRHIKEVLGEDYDNFILNLMLINEPNEN